MQIKKLIKVKAFLLALMVIISLMTVWLCIEQLKTSNSTSILPQKLCIVIDAGHGGIDGGATGVKSGVKESSLNLEVSKLLARLIDSAGMQAVMTRQTEAGLYGTLSSGFKKRDMLKRKEIIERANADLIISIHMNKCGIPSRRGAQVFYSDDKSKQLAITIQDSINEMPESIRKYSPLNGDFYILNCTKRLGVLIECGFLSNVEDEKLLLNDNYRQNFAYALFKGLITYLNLNV